ncbi:MAG: hypothetical protein LH630_10900 [Actinomycetia bacterium]|nr:hypothetical protein [Actinomycetes bacterium]
MRISTPLGRLPASAVIAGNVVFWPSWTVLVGLAAQRMPDARFANDNVISRQRGFERGDRWYRDTLRIDRWKSLLPEAGATFGGFEKRTVNGGDQSTMEQFVIETRRAEHAHWAMLGGVLLTLLWNPWWAAPANIAFAAGSNVPCIAVQRYNRVRLRRTLAAIRRRATSSR